MNDAPSVQTIDALIADYVAGNLCLPAKIMVDAHMELVPESRQWAADLEDVHGAAFSNGSPVDLNDADGMLANIMDAPGSDPDEEHQVVQSAVFSNVNAAETANQVPQALQDYIGMKLEDVPWRMKMPGVYSYRLDDVDSHEVALLRIKPGVAIPSHTHEGCELTFVLQGAFEDSEGRYGRGDISVADEHVDHEPVACEGEECICFVVTDAPLRFNSTLTRIVSSILPN